MVQLTINNKSKEAKALLEYLKNLSFVKISDKKFSSEQIEKSPYNDEFVKKINKARAEKGGLEVNPDTLWESIK
jgi:hypothetical protein